MAFVPLWRALLACAAVVLALAAAPGCSRSGKEGSGISSSPTSTTEQTGGSREFAPAEEPGTIDTSAEKTEPEMLSKQARRKLLDLARRAVEAAVRGQRLPPGSGDDSDLQGRQGAFVTLKTDGRLRGCIGRFLSEEPLWKTVQEMAVASATEDPRFWGMRLRPEELPGVNIEISVLSPLEEIENPLDFELGKHGIYVRCGTRTGCFLPQVAGETGWSKEEFLSNCCAQKAGLSPDAWKGEDTEVFVFTAETISESDPQEPAQQGG